MMPEQITTAAVFGAVFGLLYIGHRVGDTWGQRSVKQVPGPRGALHCAIHVAMLTGTKLLFLVPGGLVLGLPVSVGGVVLALLVDAMSHYLVDRGRPLHAMAAATGNSEFITRVTVVRSPDGPAATTGPGTGTFELDQAWHLIWIGVAALIIAGFSA